MSEQIKRALLVDDCEVTRRLIGMALAATGVHEFIVAADGAEAIARLQAEKVEVVILDRRMSGMDGLECTRRIRAGIDGIDPHISIVLLTAVTGSESEREAYEAGVDLFMEKPISIRKIQAGISRIIAGKTQA